LDSPPATGDRIAGVLEDGLRRSGFISFLHLTGLVLFTAIGIFSAGTGKCAILQSQDACAAALAGQIEMNVRQRRFAALQSKCAWCRSRQEVWQ